jgi:chemotaxis protein histidine kinase CheA/CheY-like chemotaxis protein
LVSDEGFDPEELAMLRQSFRDEAHEALESVTARALAAGAGTPSPDALTEMMRVTHTLKGSAGTIGLPDMVDLAHRLETAFAQVRSGHLRWTAVIADQVVEIVDGIRAHVDGIGDDATAAAHAGRVRALLDHLGEGSGDSPVVASRVELRDDSAPVAIPEPAVPGAPIIVREISGPIPVPRTPTESDGVPRPVDRADTTVSITPASDFPAGADGRALLRVEPERIDALMSSTGELLFDRTRIERRVQLLRTLARDLGRTRQALRDELGALRGAASDDARAALEERLRLVESALAGQATQLAQTTAALLDETEALRRTIGEIQRGLLRTRMQTSRALFAHLARSLRALTRRSGPRVELRTTGDDTEFDKALAEQLTDPLVQLLRNAVVHGIEPTDERVKHGKPAVGTIRVAARHDGNLVVVELADDGRGIDPRRLRERFVATARWTPARAELASDDDVLAAIFEPGVSSRDDADELSGRGIGLDLVRETIARLGGEIRLSSTPGRGTTFTMRLPVSTAVTQAMLFKVHGQVYALPQVHVVETTSVDADASTIAGRHEQIPVVRLEHVLADRALPPTADPGRRSGVIVAYAGKSLVCTVDKVVGPREIVVRPMGPLLAPLPLYAGATISGSGKVQLILDPAALVRLAYPGSPVVDVPAAASPGNQPLAGRVLVVDDSRAIREALTSMLARDGWIVDLAEDGARAWHMAQQLRYDLIVTDLEMPRLGGFDLIGRLRGATRLADTPVVIITSRATPENRRRARDLGVRALVAKPVTRRKLLEALAAR